MISMFNYKKKYLDDSVLSFSSLEFQDTGFYLIVGRSGCGKTTLLNAISLLDTNFQGTYKFKNQNIDLTDDEQNAVLRNEYFSYLHQKPVLLEDFTVLENLSLFSQASKDYTAVILNEYNLSNLQNKKVKQLSGGERQRLALVKAVVQNKPIIICDEPTGNLDSENAKFIVEKLKKLSETKLVIVVSHDVELFIQYADYKIKIVNKKLEYIEKTSDNLANKNISRADIVSNKKIFKKFEKKVLKKRKGKNFLLTGLSVACLVCFSLTLLVGINVKKTINEGFAEFFKPNEVFLRSKKNDIKRHKNNSLTNNELNEVLNLLEVENDESRIFYTNNLETFFKDGNSLNLVTKYHTSKIDGYSARSFNEFILLDDECDYSYISETDLESDEIIISINNPLMLQICLELKIVKTFDALYDYIVKNSLNVSLFIKNYDWQYEDEQIFKVVGFVVENGNKIYHSNKFFNYYIFEENMRLPSSIYDEILDKPWYLKRDIILPIKYEKLNLFYTNKFLSNYYVRKITYDDCSLWYEKNEVPKDDLYFVYKKSEEDCINFTDLAKIVKNECVLSNDLYLTSDIMNGFVNEVYFANSKNKIDYLEDNYFKENNEGFINLNDESIISSGILVKNKNSISLRFCRDFDKNLNKNQLVISRGLYKLLFGNNKNQERSLYMIAIKNRIKSGNNISINYTKTQFEIAQILDYEEIAIYGDQFVVCNFFRDYFCDDYYNYKPNCASVYLSNENEAVTFKNNFYDYNVSEPFKDMNVQVDQILKYFEIILSIFTFLVLIISIFILVIVLKSLILDSNREIFVLYTNGFSKNKILYIYNKYVLKILLKSTLFTIVFSVFLNFITYFIVTDALSVNLNFTFYYEQIIALFALFGVLLFISFMSNKKFIKNTEVSVLIRN